jgi:hypothetical protein
MKNETNTNVSECSDFDDYLDVKSKKTVQQQKRIQREKEEADQREAAAVRKLEEMRSARAVPTQRAQPPSQPPTLLPSSTVTNTPFVAAPTVTLSSTSFMPSTIGFASFGGLLGVDAIWSASATSSGIFVFVWILASLS